MQKIVPLWRSDKAQLLTVSHAVTELLQRQG
jgi:hypothetical protein